MAKQDITKSVDRMTFSDERSTGESSSSLSFNTLRLAAKSQPRIMKLDLLTLPQFNVTNIARCLSVSERLQLLTQIHRRFREFVYHPQCFPDMSFFPVDDREQHDPKILSSNGSCGITYVEINIYSKHPFVQVAMMAGMWNFRADLWDSLRWPHSVNIESLQLTLDHGTESAEVHLDCLPGSNLPQLPPPAQTVTAPRERSRSLNQSDSVEEVIMRSIESALGSVPNTELTRTVEHRVTEEARNTPRAQQTVLYPDRLPEDQEADNSREHRQDRHQTTIAVRPQSAGHAAPLFMRSDGEERSARSFEDEHCISPTTRRPMDLQCRLRNLFFIRFENPRTHPVVFFPRSLWGLGLQSFTSSTFSKPWWRHQLQVEQRFESLRFLVLSCCSFSDDELQMLLTACPNLEHLSMRYVQWEGNIQFPPSLLSLGYFPDKEDSGYYSLDRCHKLWQISTRINENEEEAIRFLNHCNSMNSVQRVKFEFIRKPNFSDPRVSLDGLHSWENRAPEKGFTVAVADDDLEAFPELKEIFPVEEEQFVDIEAVRFEDCPLWSDESMEFIHMTTKRKLLLR